MRTTLKRGIGRAAGLNGNGHSALPPLFGPITRYRQPEPPRRSFVGLLLRGFGWFVLALVVVSSGIGGGYYLYLHRAVQELAAPTHSGTARASRKLSVIKDPSQPAIALIAGYDHRAGTGSKSYAGSNSDTLMLVRANPQNHTLSLLSFPRDLNVSIYCHGDTVATQDRINAAWADCGNNGPYATVDTMEHLTNLPINYLITLDFHAFKQLVNHLHGVYMNVDRRYYNPKGTGWSAIDLQPGYQKLDGGQALSYVRFRHLDSDIYRTGRQQLFIEALKARLRTQLSLSSLPLELPKLIGILKGNLEYVKAGGGAVSLSELESYLSVAYHLPAGHLFRDQIPSTDFQNINVNGADELSAPQSAIDQAVQRFLHPVVKPARQIGIPGLGPAHAKKKKQGRKLPPKQVSVLVLNAGRIPGEAANATYLLTKHGYATKTLPPTMQANAPSVHHYTTVYYDPVQPNAKLAAQQLAPLFGSHSKVSQFTPTIAAYAQKAGNPLTVVAVGTDFHGTLHIQRPPKVLPRQVPQVSDGVSVTEHALSSVLYRAHFPLMVPHKIAAYSQLSSGSTVEGGVRVFKPVKNQHEVVLTFGLPNGIEYWQIEETTWSSAPILANPTGRFFYHHQEFLLYTTGGAIQMVVLRTPKATYWVVNSILNQISNATMVAIAESLQPLGR
jgi:LCP family protein required for cell wall assembly